MNQQQENHQVSITSFYNYYSINESTKIDLDQINNIKDDKLFVSVGGGIGAGKSFLTKRTVELPIIDVDEFVSEVGGGEYDRANLGAGRSKFNKALDRALEGDKSFIHMGTNQNVNAARKRLQRAKENNFTTVLVLIDTKPEIAARQAQKRVETGERNPIPMERIIQSREDALNTFKTLIRDNDIVDFYVHYKKY